MNTQTGNFIAVSGLIVFILSRFGVVVNDTEIVAVISGVVALYGIIHQFFITKKVVGMARSFGAKI